ncbi:lipopolysaccharide-induced tumor necrosis factor-alpha factor homolog [Anopheles albimanus]|uniref:lipopolysaccharide-induced tumor necrosis factor-alpha factor homolog n=1 Tax=Anopheles albimanus TaxID=7167 RepID=UPI00163F378E|nr:lipopolysaccharide-induced tumor necrosis factor-alpha factor homolog [Anopheles albimanus]XP_035774145.1 lipopolysaccharide-induced tumor necrosis factor-alpha factor homolog [Anopheles albimanus]
MSEKGAAGYQTQPLNQPPYPAQQQPPGYVPQIPQGTTYPHPPSGAPNYAHPAPPPPYDANSNVMPGIPPPGVTTYVQVVTRPQVGPDPSAMMCPSCSKHVVTRLDYDSTTKTHIAAGLLCLFGCWPCFWIPYVVDSCKSANHYCPNCGAYIGTYHA